MYTIGVSTSSFFPHSLEDAFRLAKEAGAEGMEIMVTNAPETQDPRVLDFLSRRFDLPIVSIHAPVLLLTHGVFGYDPAQKLERSAELAVMLGADTVVVHPPFRWQVLYSRRFEKVVHDVADAHGVTIAVENMFGWAASSINIEAYAPSWNPGRLDLPSLTSISPTPPCRGLAHCGLPESGVSDSLTFICVMALARKRTSTFLTNTYCPEKGPSRWGKRSNCLRRAVSVVT